MNTDNITKGLAKKDVGFDEISDTLYQTIVFQNNRINTAQVFGESIVEADNNAELICEAFNVAQETGLSPIQMKERIKELEGSIYSALKKFQLTDYHPEVVKILRNALNPKTEKCKCKFPLVRNDGKEYCGNCNEDI